MIKAPKTIIASALLGLSALTACVPAQSQYTGATMMQRNEVKSVRYTHDFTLPSGEALSAETEQRLFAFFRLVNLQYGDVVSLDSGDEQTASAAVVARFLQNNGIRIADRAPIIGAAPKSGEARLIVERFVLVPPNCSSGRGQVGNNWNNATSANFGCSSQALLGLMVADKRDLILPNNDRYADTDSAVMGVVLSRIDTSGSNPTIGVSFEGVSGLSGQ